MSDGLSRRSFLKLAATAGAAAAVPGCEPAARKLIPYVVPDENVIPGVPAFFATTCDECSAGCGVIARVREGRVIKLEGNPADPISQGSLCARGQSALQGLYNPDRLRTPMARQSDGSLKETSWDDSLAALADKLKAAAGKGRSRVAFIGAPQGPTLAKIVSSWAGAHQSDRVVFFEPLSNEPARAAAQTVFGRRDLPAYRLDQAEVLISFDADFLETWQSPVELARQYAEFRSPKTRRGSLTIGRSIYVGPRLNATAGKSDQWVAIPAGAQAMVAMSVLNVILRQGWVAPNSGVDVAALKAFAAAFDPASVSAKTGVLAGVIERMGETFGKADGAVALAGGIDPATHLACMILNAATGNVGRTVQFFDGAPTENESRPEQVAAVVNAMRSGQVDVLVVAGSNPVYALAPALKAAEAIGKVPFVVWMGTVPDETAALAHLLIPTHHTLESWRDTNPRAGVYGLGQPVMQPVFKSHALGDLLIDSARRSGSAIAWKDSADAVRSEWMKAHAPASGQAADAAWTSALAGGGLFENPRLGSVRLNAGVLKAPALADVPKLALVAFPHPMLFDGRGADKPWLQEIPEPVSQIVWDSWAEIHPDTAREIGVAHNEIVEVRSSEGAIQAPVLISERVRAGVIAVPLGQGHTQYGRYAKDRGTNAWAALKPGNLTIEVTATTTHQKRELITPLGKSEMLGRSIVEATSVAALANGERREEEQVPEPHEMYAPIEYPNHQWGMTIDVNACTGCSACVAACYAENNLAVVGKDEISYGRIMSWMRIERYFPEKEDAPLIYLSPMLCQQCAHAPCEPVCPVFASYHTQEGLNGQVYNRCVGTRYCENNCTYKVRRFNWYDPEFPEPLNYQLNPDVTVRGAGVMEKCTFCIQRIRHAEITAKVEDRPVRDGEIVTACQQACPAKAITFGDMKDPQSAMMKRRAENQARNYRALEEFNNQPAIVYLRDVYNQREKA